MAESIILDPYEGAPVALLSNTPPSVRAVGTVANGTGNITPGLPAGTAKDDLLFMYVESNFNEPVTAPDGWTHVVGSPVLGSLSDSCLSVLWKRAVAGEVAPTIQDPGDHAVARIVGVQNGARIDAALGSSATGSPGTGVTILGVDTKSVNCLVLSAVATGTDTASTTHVSSWANANLSGVTEQVDNWVTDGSGGGIGVASGVRANAGPTGSTTATLGTAALRHYHMLAVAPRTRTQVDITPWVSADGVDWGEGGIEQYLAEEATYGSAPVDFRVPNRTINIPLRLRADGTFTFEQARRLLQAKTSLFQREGGVISRTPANGTTVYADVMNARLRLGGGWGQANRDYDVDASLELETLPEFWGAEVLLDQKVELANPEIVTVLQQNAGTAIIAGDYPARCRIVVDESQAVDQRAMLWGFRSRNYSSATSAALAYEAEALTPLGNAGTATVSGASGGGSNNVIQVASLASSWTPVLSTQILSGSVHMTHMGTYRVWARVYTTSAVPPAVRLSWDVGDLLNPTLNSRYQIPSASAFYIADLGQISLRPTGVGYHRWQGSIQAIGTAGGENVSIDRVWFQPLDEAAGLLRATVSLDEGAVPYAARDEFNQTAGTLTSKALPVGGTWGQAGAATDFSVDATNRWVTRAASSGIRYARAGTAVWSDVIVQCDVSTLSGRAAFPDAGVVVRYVDASNHMYVSRSAIGGVTINKRVSGSDSTLLPNLQGVVSTNSPNDGKFERIKVYVASTGVWQVYFNGALIARGYDSVFATGGTLASGGAGLRDDPSLGTPTPTNAYDNFSVWVPAQDAALFASRSASVGTSAIVRADSAGVAYGPVSWVSGDIPRLPVSGAESRPVEIFVKPSRGDLDSAPDAGIDDVSARVYYRPCYLFVPGA